MAEKFKFYLNERMSMRQGLKLVEESILQQERNCKHNGGEVELHQGNGYLHSLDVKRIKLMELLDAFEEKLGLIQKKAANPLFSGVVNRLPFLRSAQEKKERKIATAVLAFLYLSHRLLIRGNNQEEDMDAHMSLLDDAGRRLEEILANQLSQRHLNILIRDFSYSLTYVSTHSQYYLQKIWLMAFEKKHGSLLDNTDDDSLSILLNDMYQGEKSLAPKRIKAKDEIFLSPEVVLERWAYCGLINERSLIERKVLMTAELSEAVDNLIKSGQLRQVYSFSGLIAQETYNHQQILRYLIHQISSKDAANRNEALRSVLLEDPYFSVTANQGKTTVATDKLFPSFVAIRRGTSINEVRELATAMKAYVDIASDKHTANYFLGEIEHQIVTNSKEMALDEDIGRQHLLFEVVAHIYERWPHGEMALAKRESFFIDKVIGKLESSDDSFSEQNDEDVERWFDLLHRYATVIECDLTLHLHSDNSHINRLLSYVQAKQIKAIVYSEPNPLLETEATNKMQDKPEAQTSKEPAGSAFIL